MSLKIILIYVPLKLRNKFVQNDVSLTFCLYNILLYIYKNVRLQVVALEHTYISMDTNCVIMIKENLLCVNGYTYVVTLLVDKICKKPLPYVYGLGTKDLITFLNYQKKI
jgi:hypothetical protein